MIWNSWKRIKELEREAQWAEVNHADAERAFQNSMQRKDERITELKSDIALLLDGHIEALDAKVKARLEVNSSMTQNLYSQLAMAHNLRNHYMPPVGGIGNLMGGIF
jgi:hypothetical protein